MLLKNCKEPDNDIRDLISKVTREYTLEVFQNLNKYMNTLGLCIAVRSSKEKVIQDSTENKFE